MRLYFGYGVKLLLFTASEFALYAYDSPLYLIVGRTAWYPSRMLRGAQESVAVVG